MVQSIQILLKWFDPQPKQSGIVYFDGVCSVCNGFIDFLIKRDPTRSLRYAPLQGTTAAANLDKKLYQEVDSLIFQSGDKIYSQSNAALMAIASVGGIWKLAITFRIIPRFIRDAVYKVIARNRYKWFGKRDACRMPTMAELELILD